jgi:hypothetical protein
MGEFQFPRTSFELKIEGLVDPKFESKANSFASSSCISPIMNDGTI